MTRPSVLPLFDTNGTRIAAPAGIRISDGYGVNAPLPSQDLNYMFYWLSQWNQWLATGDVDFNNVDIVGTLTQEGAATFESSVDMEGGLATFAAWALKGIQAIPALALGFTNNLALPGGNGALVYNVTWSGSSNPAFPRGFTGFVAPTDGRIAIIRNQEAASPAGAYASHRVALYHEHASSTAANRIHLPNGSLGLRCPDAATGTGSIPGLVIPPDGIVALRYDLATARWNVIWTSFNIHAVYSQRSVGFSPVANFSNAAYSGLSGGSGNDAITSSGAGVWKVWSSDIQFLDPGDTVIGFNIFARITGTFLNVTLLEKSFSGAAAVINPIGTINAGASSVLTTPQLIQVTGLTWTVEDNATYFVQVDAPNGSSPESLYWLQLIVAKQNG